MPIVNKGVFKNIYDNELSYIPIYISSGANSPLSFIPLPFHGFISIVQNKAILGFLMKTNTFNETPFKQFSSEIPELNEIIKLNTSPDTIENIHIQTYINICREIMGEDEPDDPITDKDIYQIKSKLGSIKYFNEIIDTDGYITSNYRYILEKHNEIRKRGEQHVGDSFIPSNPIEKHNLIIKASTELGEVDLGDGCILPLIDDLKNINNLIVKNNSCIFKEFPIISETTRRLYSELKTFSENTDLNSIPTNFIVRNIKSLYPFSTTNYTNEDFEKTMWNISILNTYVPQVKKDQIFNSVRLDDILNDLYTFAAFTRLNKMMPNKRGLEKLKVAKPRGTYRGQGVNKFKPINKEWRQKRR